MYSILLLKNAPALLVLQLPVYNICESAAIVFKISIIELTKFSNV